MTGCRFILVSDLCDWWLQEDLIAKLEQEGAGSSRLGLQAGPSSDGLAEQVQADVPYHRPESHVPLS